MLSVADSSLRLFTTVLFQMARLSSTQLLCPTATRACPVYISRNVRVAVGSVACACCWLMLVVPVSQRASTLIAQRGGGVVYAHMSACIPPPPRASGQLHH